MRTFSREKGIIDGCFDFLFCFYFTVAQWNWMMEIFAQLSYVLNNTYAFLFSLCDTDHTEWRYISVNRSIDQCTVFIVTVKLVTVPFYHYQRRNETKMLHLICAVIYIAAPFFVLYNTDQPSRQLATCSTYDWHITTVETAAIFFCPYPHKYQQGKERWTEKKQHNEWNMWSFDVDDVGTANIVAGFFNGNSVIQT